MGMKGFFKSLALFCAALLVSCLIVGLLFASEPSDVSLNPIVVSTASRYEENAQRVPAPVTVITQNQIKSSKAQNLPGLLRSHTGMAVRDLYGNGAKSQIDMRGFGSLSSMNTLVLVDGRRLNETDTSGIDWTQIPLEQIESVEILHGGSGAVLYGDNATAGVINIRTKKGAGKPRWQIGAEGGSYDYNKQDCSLSGASKDISYYLDASRQSTHGYRTNSFFKAQDFATRLSYSSPDGGEARTAASVHVSEYGLPGSLSDSELIQYGRRGAKYVEDHAKDRDYSFSLGGKQTIGPGTFDADVSYRRHETDSFFLEFYGGWGNPIKKNRITTVGITPKYIIDSPVFDHGNTLIAGFDHYRSDFASNNYDYADVLKEFSDIDKISRGGYIQDEFSLMEKLILKTGGRYEKATYEFDYHDNSGFNADINSTLQVSEHAYSSGLVFLASDASSVFANANRSFRFPAADEYNDVWAVPPVNTGLRPQGADTFELGVKHNAGKIKADASVYRMDVKDEIYYDFANSRNANYEKTVHQGIDLSLKAEAGACTDVKAQYGYTDAYFNGGVNDKKHVPLVPKHKLNLGIDQKLTRDLMLAVSGTFTGKRPFLNDNANALTFLNGYFILDASTTWKQKNLSLSFGVNNILNKRYSEYASSNPATSKKVYYPSPERNFFTKLTYNF